MQALLGSASAAWWPLQRALARTVRRLRRLQAALARGEREAELRLLWRSCATDAALCAACSPPPAGERGFRALVTC